MLICYTNFVILNVTVAGKEQIGELLRQVEMLKHQNQSLEELKEEVYFNFLNSFLSEKIWYLAGA